MNRSKTKKFILVALVMVLVATAALHAILCCWQIGGCDGPMCCWIAVRVDGCFITCLFGGVIGCPTDTGRSTPPLPSP
jgi:F0F1-type ATP synthase assembly protein I